MIMWFINFIFLLKQPIYAEPINLLKLSWNSESQISSNSSPLLGDLFYISSADPDLDKSLILEPLPSQWRDNLKINRVQAIEWFRPFIQQKKINTKVRLSINMPEQVTIIKNQNISPIYLKNLALLKIKQLCQTCELHLLESKSNSNLVIRPTLVQWTGINQQQLLFTHSSEDLSSGAIFDIWVNDQVWVTQVPFLIGDKLTQDKLMVQNMVLKWSQALVALKSSVLPEQYMAVNSINSHNYLKISDVKKNKVVKIGQPMKGIFKGDQFSIETAVIARESGAIGDQIKVYKSDTRKELMAKVIADDQVEIIP